VSASPPFGERIRAGALALGGHEFTEHRNVHVQALFGRGLNGEIDREPERIVQGEGVVTGQGGLAGVPGPGCRTGQHRCPLGQGPQEAVLFGICGAADPVPIPLELRIGGLHRILRGGQEFGHDVLVNPEEPHRPDHATHQAAQHVPAALVRGGHSVADQHQGGADVIGHHAESHVRLGIAAVCAPGEFLGLGDNGKNLVDLVEVARALEEVGDTFETHPGVDVLLGEFTQDFEILLAGAAAAFHLHEHEVPDLQEPVLVHDRSAIGPKLGSPVHVDLRTGSGRSGLSRGPEVILHAAPLDAFGGESRHAAPQACRLVVPLVHRHPDGIGIESEEPVRLRSGHQLPRVGDSTFLEVVAEGEVAVHLEERAMPGGLADFVDVEGAHALLDRCGPWPRRCDLSEHVGDEGHHPGHGEQQ
jgi:hypothetical protein